MFSKFAVTALCCGAMVAAAAAQSGSMSGMNMGTPAGQGAMSADLMSSSFDGFLKLLDSGITETAEAMPADKYDFAPSQAIFKDSQKTDFATVRTFGEQVRHIAQANYYFFGSKGANPGFDPKTIDKMKTKEESVAALKKSFEFAHAQVALMTAANAADPTATMGRKSTRAASIAFGMAHMNDHYGQLCEYLRMNGIIPPPSRK